MLLRYLDSERPPEQQAEHRRRSSARLPRSLHAYLEQEAIPTKTELIEQLSDEELFYLHISGPWARAKQLPPDETGWRVWLPIAGRGFGKTRAGAEWIRSMAESGAARSIAWWQRPMTGQKCLCFYWLRQQKGGLTKRLFQRAFCHRCQRCYGGFCFCFGGIQRLVNSRMAAQ